MNKRRRWKAKARRHAKLPDRCQVCAGKRGGVRGNENVVAGKIMCDYCHADLLQKD